VSKSSRSEVWGVFHEDESWFHLANDPCHFPPEAGVFAVGSLSFLVGTGYVGAGESPADDICAAVPRLAVEGRDIIPNREPWEYSIPLPLQQDAAGVWFNFDSADGSMSAKDSAENSSPAASK
jgi:hypothetical protein